MRHNRWFLLISLAVLPACLGSVARAVVITNSITINTNDLAYENADLQISNCTVTVHGPHVFGAVTLQAGGIIQGTSTNLQLNALTLEPGATMNLAGNGYLGVAGTLAVHNTAVLLQRGANTSGQVGGQWVGAGGIIEAMSVVVTAGGKISADSQGYVAGQGLAGGPGNAGGSHAGIGGNGPWGAGGTNVYGNGLAPVALGSGGGGYDGLGGGSGGAGGGAIHLRVEGLLALDGEISADGQSMNTGRGDGAGAGGSLWIQARNLSGGGRLHANGGSSLSGRGGGGGGGRVAVYYEADSGFLGYTNSTTAGGSGAGSGTMGTAAFFCTGVTNQHLQVFNLFRLPPCVTSSYGQVSVLAGGNLVLGGGGQLLVDGALWVASNSTLTVQSVNQSGQVGGQWLGAGGRITASNVTVQAGARITADALGYLAGVGPGAAGGNAGGTHGGAGGNGAWGAASTNLYGEAFAPGPPGSGGGGYDALGGGSGGAGGGGIQLAVLDQLALDGEISAAGQSMNTGRGDGAGAGGSLWVQTRALTGAGCFRARGGNSTSGRGGGGGGGRIAVFYEVGGGFLGYTNSSAAGGTGVNAGAAGSSLFSCLAVTNQHLQVFQYLRLPATSTSHFGQVTVAAGGNLVLGGGAELQVDGTLRIATNSTLTAQSIYPGGTVAGAWAGAGDRVVAANIVIENGARVNADALGYGAALGPAGAGGNSGGTHAGVGGTGPWCCANTNVYGDEIEPVALGSGGGGYDGLGGGSGGAGGGAIELNAREYLALDGEISANGQSMNTTRGDGGGAGGSVYINALGVQGAGRILARGGNSTSGRGGGGGGGRIAVHYYASCALDPTNLVAAGGGGAIAGSTGTVGAVLCSTNPVFRWKSVPQYAHGTEWLQWLALSLPADAAAADVVAFRNEQRHDLALAQPIAGGVAWDTTQLSNGWYDLRVLFRLTAPAQAVGSLRQAVLVNNALAWHGGTLLVNETWASGTVHVVEGDFVVGPGVTLTVAPGAIVKFVDGATLTVAAGATLDALGTAQAAILFTSFADDTAGGDSNLDGDALAPRPGDWGGVANAGGTLNLNDFTVFRYSRTTHAGALAGNEIWLGTYLHYITNDLVVTSGVHLTIQPGAVVKFDNKKKLTIQAGGFLNAAGNLAQPITFTSWRDDTVGGDSNRDGNRSTPQPGDWIGLYFQGGTGVLECVAINHAGGSQSGNWDTTAGAIVTRTGADVSLARSVILDALFEGILAWEGGTVNAVNSVINGANRGVNADGTAVVRLINCTLYNNGTGLWGHGGQLDVRNTIIAGSLQYGIDNILGGALAIRYSDVWSATGTNYYRCPDPTGLNGNLATNPALKDAATGDFRLNFLSPCIDAAEGTNAPAADYMGAPRYTDPRTLVKKGTPCTNGAYADMGAYEFVETASSEIDLVPAFVAGPLAARAGDDVTLSWITANIGSAPARGPWHDEISLALVRDHTTNWVTVGEVVVGVGLTLGPGQSCTNTASLRVPGSVPGDHAWQVFVNRRDEVFEGQNRTNNTRFSAAPLNLDLNEVLVNGPAATNILATGQYQWFKFRADNLLDVLLGLDLAGAGASELYAARDSMPDRQHFDYAQAQWNSADVSTLVGVGRTGWYYCAAYGAEVAAGSAAFSLRATNVPYGLTGVDLNTIGNTGRVTLTVFGSQLGSNYTYLLVGGGVTLTAAAVQVVNPTRAWLTFDVNGLPPGEFSLQMLSAVSTSVLAQAGSVVPGGADFWWNLVGADTIRVGRPATYTVSYGNQGICDAGYTLLLVFGIPNSAAVAPGAGFTNRPAPACMGVTTPTCLRTVLEVAGTALTPLVVPPLRPGQAGSATFSLATAAQGDFDIQVWRMGTCLADGSSLAGQLGELDCSTNALLLAPAVVREESYKLPRDTLIALWNVTQNCAGQNFVGVRFLSGSQPEGWACGGAALHLRNQLIAARNADPGGPLTGWDFFSITKTGHTTVMGQSPEGQLYIIDNYLGEMTLAVAEENPPGSGLYSLGNIMIGSGAYWIVDKLAGLKYHLYNADEPGTQCMDPYIGGFKKYRIKSRGSDDPNKITGPLGYGEAHWIDGGHQLQYTIYYENDPTNATLPAQVVRISHALHNYLDWSTLQFTDFNIGGQVYAVAPGLQYYYQRLDRTTNCGLWVDAVAAVQPTNGLVTWEFISIDPNTGQLTEDPVAGFLPPNTNAPAGEGSVSFTIQAHTNLVTGQQIDVAATIIFDANNPLATPVYTNTIDKTIPTSHVQALPESSPAIFAVNWSGSDAGGPGIWGYQIYARRDAEPYQLWLTTTNATSGVYTGMPLAVYSFYSIAVDGVGLSEATVKSGTPADAWTRITARLPWVQLLLP